MFLAEAKVIALHQNAQSAVDSAIEKWEDFPASTISHHGEDCCRIAREWMLAMDYSLMTPGEPLMGPRWIRSRCHWGPSPWPIHWCEAVSRTTIDCGAFAALSQEVFHARGVQCHTAQFIQQYTEDSGQHWNKSWERDNSKVHWVKDDLCYHEACAVVVRDSEVRIWDPTAGWWVNARQFPGYSAVLAVRILADQPDVQQFNWGPHNIAPNRWQKLDMARADATPVAEQKSGAVG